MDKQTLQNPSSTGLDAFGRRRLVQVVVMLLVVVGLYFLSAGSFNLPWGWVYLGVALLSLVVGGIYVLRLNPQAINERGRPAENQKAWDKIFVTFYTPLYFIVFILPGLDARFGWSQMPLWLHLLGVVGTFAGSFLTYAAMAHNPYLAQVAQISDQRGHRVATGGPYSVVRHPMYASFFLSYPGLAFLFGSWWTFIPVLLACILVIIRTTLEDRMLQAELPGYAAYASRVHFRLLPGVW